MAWLPGGNKQSMEQKVAGDEPGPAPKGKSALPPACPRCELMKGQFTRTIQNYQKAYKKKVEGLKGELKTTRTANTRLTKQVKQLNSLARIHVPSVAVGLLVGALSVRFLGRLLQRRTKAAAVVEAAEADEEQVDQQEGLNQQKIVPAVQQEGVEEQSSKIVSAVQQEGVDQQSS